VIRRRRRAAAASVWGAALDARDLARAGAR
jgi:hypothetical protein